MADVETHAEPSSALGTSMHFLHIANTTSMLQQAIALAEMQGIAQRLCWLPSMSPYDPPTHRDWTTDPASA